MTGENALVELLAAAMGSQRRALQAAGVSRSTWHYRGHPRETVDVPVPHKDRAQPARIDDADRARITALIQEGWAAGVSVDHSFAAAWDDGVMLGSRRSWWRIAQGIEDQSERPQVPTRRGQAAGVRPGAPVVVAHAPMDAWCWDITDLRSPWQSLSFKAYCVMDIYSRKVVGWRVEEREVDGLAVEMFERAFGAEGIPGAVHADSGAAMRSNAVGDLFADLGITKTHNRPRVSNDNPYSESAFKTMKYRPAYPGTFDTIEDARTYMEWFVPWHNSQHKHSGIALFSPDEVHDGSWREKWAQRQATLTDYYERHPRRYLRKPSTPAPATTVGINWPPTEQQPTAA